MPEISAREWRWLIAASLVVLAIFSIPYAIGWLSASPGMRFSGFLLGIEDMYSYIAKMRYGARDGWAVQLLYTSEPHAGGYVYMQLLALGKLTALVSGQGASVSTDALITAYHSARLVFGALLLIATYMFIARFVTEPAQRRIAWVIASVGGGFGWLEAMWITVSGVTHLPPVEYYIPEAFTSLLLFSLPHLELARALLLLGWLAFFAAVEKRSWLWASAAGGLWLGMSLCVSFYAGALGVVTVAWLAWQWIAARRVPLREIGLAAVAGVMPAIYVTYNLWLFSTNPVFAVWSSQNVLPSPPLLEYLVAYGLILGLAVPGAIALVRRGLDRRTSLLVIWPAASLVLAYIPIPVQRRLLEGMIVPLGILAAIGLVRLWNAKLNLRRAARAGAVALVFLMAVSPAFFVLGESVVASARLPGVFHPGDEVTALDWLAANAPADSIVLSTHESGMALPAYAPVRVFVGHGPETVHSTEKTATAARFFGGGMDDAARLKLLHDNAVRFVWIGHAERALACNGADCFDPARLGLVEVFRSGDYSIDEVAR